MSEEKFLRKEHEDAVNNSKWSYVLLIIILIALAVEIFFFNFRTIQSLFYNEIECPMEQIGVSGLIEAEDCLFAIDPNSEEHIIGLLGVDLLLAGEKLHNIYLDIDLPDAVFNPNNESGICRVTCYGDVAEGERFHKIGENTIVKGNKQSQFYWLYPSGKVNVLHMYLELSDSYGLYINKIVLNAHRPMCFSMIRFGAVALVLIMSYAFRRGSLLWKVDCITGERWKWGIAFLLCVLYIGPAWYMIRSNPLVDSVDRDQEYNYLAEAFSKGSLALLQKPSEQLMALSNPYDTVLRGAREVDYMFDTAYYNGEYYVYFGVVPCLIAFLPFYVITGQYLGASYFIFACAVAFYWGFYLLLRELIKRFFPKVSFAGLLIMTSLGFWGSQIPLMLNSPKQYEVPVICGITMIVWGLFLWIASVTGEAKLRKKSLIIGSGLMALAVGCRPTLALYSFLVIPLFLGYTKKADNRKRCQLGLMVLLPYIPVAAGLMWYNYVRFDSPFQFGHIYNLTAFDYTNLPYSIDQLVIGIYDYLFKLPQLDYSFPFMNYAQMDKRNIQENPFGHCGTILWEYSFGGLVPVNLGVWLIPALIQKSRKNAAKGVAIALVVIASVLLVIEAYVGGIVPRYAGDFFFAYQIAGCLAWMILREENRENPLGKWLCGFLVIALIVSVAFHSNYYLLSNLSTPLSIGNTELFYRIYYAFRFW